MEFMVMPVADFPFNSTDELSVEVRQAGSSYLCGYVSANTLLYGVKKQFSFLVNTHPPVEVVNALAL